MVADGRGTFSAWGGYWFVIAGMLLVFLAGAWLTQSILAGRPLRGPALHVVIGLAFAVTITVVIALFIARPGGNTARGDQPADGPLPYPLSTSAASSR
jgi:hypothetical protein